MAGTWPFVCFGGGTESRNEIPGARMMMAVAVVMDGDGDDWKH
jgi:hypothetical protein